MTLELLPNEHRRSSNNNFATPQPDWPSPNISPTQWCRRRSCHTRRDNPQSYSLINSGQGWRRETSSSKEYHGLIMHIYIHIIYYMYISPLKRSWLTDSHHLASKRVMFWKKLTTARDLVLFLFEYQPCSNYPKYPDPSIQCLFWEPIHPCVIQVHSPLHSRVQGLLGGEKNYIRLNGEAGKLFFHRLSHLQYHPQSNYQAMFGAFILLMVRSKSGENSPVEVGSLSHYLRRVLYIPGGCLGFLPSIVLPSWEPTYPRSQPTLLSRWFSFFPRYVSSLEGIRWKCLDYLWNIPEHLS